MTLGLAISALCLWLWAEAYARYVIRAYNSRGPFWRHWLRAMVFWQPDQVRVLVIESRLIAVCFILFSALVFIGHLYGGH